MPLLKHKATLRTDQIVHSAGCNVADIERPVNGWCDPCPLASSPECPAGRSISTN